jgi:hypothetical protein
MIKSLIIFEQVSLINIISESDIFNLTDTSNTASGLHNLKRTMKVYQFFVGIRR